MLSARHRRFVEEYLVDCNATRAADRAGYKHAEVQGSRLLRNARVTAAIAVEMDKRSEKLAIDAEWVLRESQDLYRECRRVKDRKTAKELLNTIGKHVDVSAFEERHKHEYGGTLTVVSEIPGAPGSEAD